MTRHVRLSTSIITVAAGVAALLWLGPDGSSPAQTLGLVRGPYLQNVTPDSAVVVWATREASVAKVEYSRAGGAKKHTLATSTYLPASETGMSGDLYSHEAEISGLSPSVEYVYDVFAGSADLTAGSDRLTTAPVPGTGTVRFLAFGDSGNGSAAQRQLAALMNADDFDLAVHTGDVAYGSTGTTGDGTHSTLTNWFFTTYGPWLRRSAFFPSMGNHDSRSSTSYGTHYLESFVLPSNGRSVTYPDHAERYYSFDYGPVHFVALDTERAFQSGARRDEQIAWLRADLAATTQPWKVVYFHRSPYSSSESHGSNLTVRQVLGPIFETHRVQLVISGHDHMYERTHPIRASTNTDHGRVTYVVTGGGGGGLYPAGASSWTAHSASVYHYVRLTGTECDLTAEAVRLDGAVFDRFTLGACGPADSVPPAVRLVRPASGAVVSGVVSVGVEATDNTGVSRVELWRNGALAGTTQTAPYTFAWNTLTSPGGSHTLAALAYDDAGNAATSAVHTVTVANALPSGWQSADIGAVGRPGAAAARDGTFTLNGAGADVWDRADAFHYAYQPLSGDGAIVARVASIQGTQAWTKMGVMIRATTSAGSAHAFMLVSSGKGLAFQRRTAAGGLSTHTTGGAGTAPRWVRLQRTGSVIVASVSSNGVNWTDVGRDTFAMPSTVLIGLAAHSHTVDATATATFDNVSIRSGPSASLPSGWQSADIGAVGRPGAAAARDGTFTLNGAGADVWDRADAFHYAYQPLSGDGAIVARVASIQGTQAWTKMGVMIRATTSAGSAHAFMLVSSGKGLAFQRRTAAGGLSTHTPAGTGTAPRWVRLQRTGSVIVASVSSNGVNWTEVGRDTFAMPSTVLIGLAAHSHTVDATATATFDRISVEQ